MSSRFQVDAFNLLGQREHFPVAVCLSGSGGEPRLAIAWNSFHQNFFSELGAFFRWTRVPQDADGESVFRDCRVQRNIPGRAIVAAALWHAVFFIVPWGSLPISPKHNSAFDGTQLTWSGPIDDLPLLNVPKHAPRSLRAKTSRPEGPTEGTDAYHPRQRIYVDPVKATHPRQTLIKPADPTEAPKFLPTLPNMVQLAATSAPARPKLEINANSLGRRRTNESKSLPADAPNLETRPSDLSMAAIPTTVARPKLDVNAGSAPRLSGAKRNGDAVPTPELADANVGAAGGPSESIIALSATPGPAAPVVEVPKGNLAARIAMSPEGKGVGSGGGSGNGNGGGNASGDGAASRNSVGISISGGNPKPNAGMSGPSGSLGKLTLPRADAHYKRIDPNANDDPPERTGPPNFAALPPGAKPEEIFGAHRVYSLNVNMPNLNSVTGSWIIRFSELRVPGRPRRPGELAGPVAVRKIDPKYPQTAIQGHIEGEVVLYGVIRADGSVDSIQLVHGIDQELDANAIAAFAQWKFEPAMRAGQPVALEAIVHIPFRGPQRD